jgi:NAD+ synthetase
MCEAMPVLDPARLVQARSEAIRAFHGRTGLRRAELDISGGVDSATMLGLLVHALGPDHITAVYSSVQSSPGSRARAREAAATFGVALVELELGPVFESALAELRRGLSAAGHELAIIDARCAEDPTILGGLRSCLRAPIGRAANRLTGGGIRHGTGNECEDRFIRFFQKGGDGEVDTNPIAMLAKGEVYQLARALGVPRAILEVEPSPDLHARGDAHTDEAELLAATGVEWTYSRIDPDTGAYRRVGTIEATSRFLDTPDAARLFDEAEPSGPEWTRMVDAAAAYFPDRDAGCRRRLLASARALERASRHKANPNCPTLGDRRSLVAAGILEDALPFARP